MPQRSTRTTLAGLVVLLALLVGGFLLTRGGDPAQTAAPPVAAGAPAAAGCAVASADVPGAKESGLPVRPLCALPAEASAVHARIRSGGPFRYDRDGTVFANAERLLPTHPRGYYHEYTVPTPGSPDRGARRLVTGSGQELYYTGDHYASFVVVDAAAVGR